MISYNYKTYSDILKKVPNTLFIPDEILSKTPIISYNHWQKVNKDKPDYIKQISMCLNILTEKNINEQVIEISKFLESDESKIQLQNKVIENIIINNYYCDLYIKFINKLNINIEIKKIIENIDELEKQLENENLIIKDKLVGLIKFICIQINNKYYKIKILNDILDNCFNKIESDINDDIKYIYADIIKTIITILNEIDNKYLQKSIKISKDRCNFKMRMNFIFLDILDIYKKKKRKRLIKN